VGSYGSVFTSPDGVAWTSRRADIHATNASMVVAFGGGFFVGVTDNGIFRSANGIDWTYVAPPPTPYGGPVAYQPGHGFVVLGAQGATFPVFTSTDGAVWTQQASGMAVGMEDVSCSATGCVAMGGAGQVYTHASPGSGGDWTPWTFPVVSTVWQSGIDFGNSTFLVPVGAGTYTSADGSIWAGPHPVTPAPGKVLTFGNGLFMTTNLMTSPDGVTWTSMTGPTVAGGPSGTLQVPGTEGAAYGPAGWIGFANLWTAITVDGFFAFMKHP